MPVCALDAAVCEAECAILYQPDTMTVLYEKNAEDRKLIASTTKIMTALVVIENTNINEIVEIKQEYTRTEGSSMYLRPGDRFTVEELLYGLLLTSGNDAAYSLAVHTAGSIQEFSKLMNNRAESIGCNDTHYENPHGLDSPDHFSTAKDLALIMAEAMNNDTFAKICGTYEYEIGERVFVNHNKLLKEYEGINGGKTGYTNAAGRTLVTSCVRNGMNLICVTLNDKNDWNDHIKLYDRAYGAYKLITAGEKYIIPVISGTADNIAAKCNTTAFLCSVDDKTEVIVNLPKFLYAPVFKGQKLGDTTIIINDTCIKYDIFASDSVGIDTDIKLTFWEHLRWAWHYFNRHSDFVPFMPVISSERER